MNKIIFILLITISSSSRAQYFNQTPSFLKANSVWVFGDSCGLDFNNGGPLRITTSLAGTEGCASVADSLGNLLFYMGNNGIIYNRNHQLMLNGTGIYPSDSYSGSSAQGALIVPVIDTPWKYYIFTNMAHALYRSGALPPYLAYSVVDMTLDNGLGGVEAGRKNIALDSVDRLSEGLIAIPGESCDIWVLTYVASTVVPPSINAFKVWHITSGGIEPNPVISNQPFNGNLGTLAISPDRQRIALSLAISDDVDVHAGTILFRFDPKTGKAFDSIYLERGISFTASPPSMNLGSVAACFSPDNSKFYHAIYHFSNYAFIEQFDISTYTHAAIEASAYRVDSGMLPSWGLKLKLYNDTIYSGPAAVSGSISRAYLSSITNPNIAGAGCNFKPRAINLTRNVINAFALPNQVVFPIISKEIISRVLSATVCKNLGTVLRAADSFYNYEWDNGDTSQTRAINAPGVYWVRYYNSGYTAFRCEEHVDTFMVGLFDELDPVINVNVFDLSTTIPYSTYQWFLNGVPIPGATNRVYSVKENGDYTVVVSDENGCTGTSDVYTVTNWTSVPDLSTMAQDIRIFPNPVQHVIHIKSSLPVQTHLCSADGRSLIQLSDVAEIPVSTLSDGFYLLRIMDKDGKLLKVEKIIKQRP